MSRVQPSSPEISRHKAKVRQTGSDAEIAIRGELYRRGLRYRVDNEVLKKPRRVADVASPGLKIVVFIDGYFWHGCPKNATWPKQNAEFWRQKIEANRLRDTDTNSRLLESGWTVLRFWKHESPIEATDTVAQAVAIEKTKRCTSSAGAHKKN